MKVGVHVSYLLFTFSTGSSWLYITPFGMRHIVNWIKREYGDVPIYITENGVSDNTGTLNDTTRVYYYKQYLNELLKGKLCKNVFTSSLNK